MWVSVTVTETGSGTPPASTPVTAEFGTTPETHDGRTSFEISLTFSEEVAVSYTTLTNGAVRTTNASIARARRRTRGSNIDWTLSVQPTSAANIILTVRSTAPGQCSAANAICTSDGRPLSAAAGRTIQVAAAAPTAVTNLRGRQLGTDNAILIEWNPPQRDDATDRSITQYTAVRENYETTAIDTRTCTTGTNGTALYDCSVTFDALTYDEHTVSVRAVNSTGEGPATSVRVDVVNPTPQTPLMATFGNVPNSHSGAPFSFRLTFSEEVDLSYRTLRDSALRIGNGRVTQARRVQRHSNRSWQITIAPTEVATVDIELPATTSCTTAGAICTADSRPLSAAVSTEVTGVS